MTAGAQPIGEGIKRGVASQKAGNQQYRAFVFRGASDRPSPRALGESRDFTHDAKLLQQVHEGKIGSAIAPVHQITSSRTTSETCNSRHFNQMREEAKPLTKPSVCSSRRSIFRPD